MGRRAIILAGGLGTRLRPYTVVLPKPLMPIGDFPILEVVIRQLARHGFDHVTLAVNHQAEIIRAFCGDGTKWGIRVDYSLEQVPLGTIGPLRLIKDLPADFLVMNGDILTDLNLAGFHDDHVAGGGSFTISSQRRVQTTDYGVLRTSPEGRLTGFEEKPKTTYEVSMGIYMVSRDALKHVPGEGPYGFDTLMHDMLRNGDPVNVVPFDGYWLDIGRPEDYMRAIDEFSTLKHRFLGD